MTSRIHAALEATGLLNLYKDKFKAESVNDVQVTLCIKNPSYKMIQKVIESPDDYELFVDAYTNPGKYSPSQQDPNTEADVNESSNDISSYPQNGFATSKNVTFDTSPKATHHSLWNTVHISSLLPNKSHQNSNSFATTSSVHHHKGKANMKSIKAFTQFLTTLKKNRFHRAKAETQEAEDVKQSLMTTTRSSTLFPEPIQIIDIPIKSPGSKADKNSSPPLIFHSHNLESILSKVGRKPVALLSIAGPSRQGKSFILSYMVKYLKFISSNNSASQVPDTDPDTDWMGKSGFKKNQPLLGGFLWRSGVERETTGIWMWPEPFTLKREDGLEFDVLLVDTQGVFDDYTDKKDWATIVGLSLLTSSCLIFNIMNNLQEDSLNTLKDFMDFGLMAKTQDDSKNAEEKPFQNLLFLIRDWNSPDDYDFGAEGGAAFLKSNLDRKNTESGAQLRSQIQQCFQHLDCFLMPEPGSKVKRSTYDGSVALMDPEFADNIQNFIEHLFSPSSFPPKIISGNLVTGDDLFLFFEQYVQIFNSDQMPSPSDMNHANALICNQTILNKCFSLYEQSMEEEQEKIQRSFLLPGELDSIHQTSQEKALLFYESSRKMGGPEEISKSRASLLQRVNDFLRLVTAENSMILKDAVYEASQKLEAHFIALMESGLKEEYSERTPDDFVGEECFENVFEKCRILSQKFVEDQLDIESLESLPEAYTNYQNILQSLKEPMLLQNRIKKSEAENRLKDDVACKCHEYKNELGNIIPKYKYWTQEQFETEEKLLSEALISKFSSVYKDSSLFSQGSYLLAQGLQTELQGVVKIVQMQNENFKMSLTYLISELCNNYTSKMEEGAQLKGELGSTHQEEKEACLMTLQNTHDFDRLLPSESAGYLKDLTSRIDKLCQMIVDKWFPRIRQKSIKNYKDTINKFYGNSGDRILEEKELNEEHDLVKAAALQDFKTFTSNIPVQVFANIEERPSQTQNQDLNGEAVTPDSPDPDIDASADIDLDNGLAADPGLALVQDFEAEVDNHMAVVKEKNRLRAEAKGSNLIGYLSQAKTLFLETLKEINESCLAEEEFNVLHTKARQDALSYFEEKCKSEASNDDSDDDDDSERKNVTHQLQEFIESMPTFFMENRSTLRISAPAVKFIREQPTIEAIVSRNPALYGGIKEVRFVATREVQIDEDLCGEFWTGKNLVICTKTIIVQGMDRLIVCSGERGKSASSIMPETPLEPGHCGINGGDGEAGESGGNIVILAEEIRDGKNLRIVSNGGQGGNGQPGGNGSRGLDGVNGDERFSLKLEDLEARFPSPAKIMDSKQNLKKGIKYLKELAEEHGTQIEDLKCINSGSKCLSVETREGGKIRYGFFQGGLKGLISGRSFYVWYQGAPGTLGQKGGLGGFGGRGGNPGNPGKIEVPEGYESIIRIVKKPGTHGTDGRDGSAGSCGSNGMQGTDHAIIDPYAGLYVPSNFLSKKKYSGRLGIYFVKFNQRNEAAFCPYAKKYMTFIDVFTVREGIQAYEEPQDTRQMRKPMKSARNKSQITKESLKLTYSISKFEPTPTVGRAGGYYVEESELRWCIMDEFIGTSVIDTHATILNQLYPNDQVAYIPCTAVFYSGKRWSTAQYLDDMIQDVKKTITSSLASIAAIVNAGRHWILVVADLKLNKIQIADTLDGYCNDNKLNDGVAVIVQILTQLVGQRKWKTKYYKTIAKQKDTHSCGPAVLYFLEQLYRNVAIQCDNPGHYLNYRKTIVKKILLTTEEGRQMLNVNNEYTKYLGMQILE